MSRHARVGIGARLKRVATMTLGAAAFAACAPSEILEVTDPDIINPSDVSSATGADAVRRGALGRLNAATSGGESFFLLGGLFADEYNNADTFIARQEIDQRIIPPINTFLTDATRSLHRARVAAQQAVALLREFKPNAPGADIAEMYFVQAFTEVMAAEHFCNGLVFSGVTGAGEEVYGSPITTAAAFEMALAHADSGLAAITGNTAADQRVRNALAVTKGRILLNLNRPADAAAAVANVPTNYRYQMFHSLTANSNQMWLLNVSARRYSVSTNEGTNGLNFATANDPRVPVCLAGPGCIQTNPRRDDNTATPLYVQRIWPTRESPVSIVSGVEARLIQAEAALRAGNYAGAGGTLEILNALRLATGTGSGGVAGLTPLLDPGTDAGRVDQLFRERAFWLFSTGRRTGDLRRLVRQYNRPAESVFPTGAWHKGGQYGTMVGMPLPQTEENNPNVPRGQSCINNNA